MERPIILLTNDDGVRAPGLSALRKEMATIGRAIVVAPDRERSAAGHSLTMDVPLRSSEIAEDVVSVEGTPTDCVLLAVKKLLPEPPDLVVSGINRGPNLADDVTYSGTVAAAMEGTLLGIPSMAISLARSPDGSFDYTYAALLAKELALLVLERGLPEGTLLNVNVPNVPAEAIEGVEIARMGKQVYEDPIIEKTDPRGRCYYWIGGQETTIRMEPDTDLAAVARQKVAVTPIKLDLTDFDAMKVIRAWPLGDATERAKEKESA